MGVILAITQGLNLVSTMGPVAVGIALQIKKLLSSGASGPTFDVQIMALKDGIVQNQDDTDKIIADWKAAHPEV
jgi:hypothetical protein